MKPSNPYLGDLGELENKRLQTLYSYKILDTPREASFDDLTQSVARSLNVPYAKIAFIDENRIWCKSTVGFVGAEAPLTGSLAQLALDNPTQTIQIKDLKLHSSVIHFSHLVSDPNIQSAIGFPIVSVDGFVLGILAAFDTKVRDFCEEELLLLQNRSRQITEMIEDKRDADLLLDTLLEQREELRSKTISNRIARTLIGSVGTDEELSELIDRFIEAVVQEFGWWAGQAWIENESEYNPGDWIFSQSAPLSVLTLNKFSTTSISQLSNSEETAPYATNIYSDLEITDLLWHPNVTLIEGAGARSFVEITVNTCTSTALKILFILPNPRALTNSLHRVLENLVTLLPQIMKRAKATQNLMHQATHDPLTGLLNRRGLEEAYPDTLIDPHGSYSRSVLFFDIDYFKEINDAYGHSVGDEALVEISRRLMSSSRPVDTVARIGGDEFLIVTPGFDNQEILEKTAQRLLHEVTQPILTQQGLEIDIKLSIGISIMNSHHSLENALKRADTMMYKAKEIGGQRFIIEDFKPLEIINTEIFGSENVCDLKIKHIKSGLSHEVDELYVSLTLPAYFAPITMSKIAGVINNHISSKESTKKPELIINAPILGKISKSNLDALFDALRNLYQITAITYCIDLKMRSQKILNFAKELNSHGLVKTALFNFGLGDNELQLIQELTPSYIVIGQKMLNADTVKNEITLSLISAISRVTNIPLVIFDDAHDEYKSILSSHDDLRIIQS